MAEELARRGAVVIDADQLAREAVAPGTPGLARVVERFGECVLTPQGTLERSAMRAMAFADAEVRADLEEIVHAEIRALRRRRDAEAEGAGASVIVHEIPLLFEVGLQDDFDFTVTVDAPVEERSRRACTGRQWTEDEFRSVCGAQLAPDEKRRRADHVLHNNGTKCDLAALVDDLWKEVMTRVDAGDPTGGA